MLYVPGAGPKNSPSASFFKTHDDPSSQPVPTMLFPHQLISTLLYASEKNWTTAEMAMPQLSAADRTKLYYSHS